MEATSPELTDALTMALALPFVPVGLATVLPCALSVGSVFVFGFGLFI